MKVLSKAKRVLTCLLVCALVLTGVVGAAPANTVQAASPKYLVLIENEKGEWTGYLKLAYKSANGGIYVYVRSLCAKLGLTYKNLGNGKFTISKNSSCYLKYQKGMKTYTYTRNSKSTGKTSKFATHLSSGIYSVYCATLSNLCYYKYFNAAAIQDDTYKNAGYAGVICYSRKRTVVQTPNSWDVSNANALGLNRDQNENNQESGSTQDDQLKQEQAEKEATVIETVVKGSSYAKLTAGAGTAYQDGQDITLGLSTFGINRTGGATVLNHPNGIASDGKHFYICDTWNNRVLCYNSLPGTGTKPDFVLGQADFNSATAGYGLNQMNWPVGIATDGTRLYVADAHNNRILVWNSLPSKSGQSADWAINLVDSDAGAPLDRELLWPWAVWTNGKKLIVTGTVNGKVLIWNSLPGSSADEPDLVLNTGGTPRTIITDGESYLLVGDHNIETANGSEAGTRVWTSFPTSSSQKQDFVLSGTSKGGCQLSDGRIVLFGDANIDFYSGKPTGSDWKPSMTISGGIKDPDDDDTYYFYNGGDFNQVIEAGGRLYVCCYNGNKVVGFQTIPTKATAKPDIVIGGSDKNEEVLLNHHVYQNLKPDTDGQKLVATDDFNGYLLIWDTLPGEDKAEPTYAMKLYHFCPWDCDLYAGKLVIAGKGYQGGKLAIWNSVPTTKKAPDYYYNGSVGTVQVQDIVGVAMDDQYLYVADRSAGKTYVFKGIPTESSKPLYTLNHAGILNADNGKLTIADESAWIYDIAKLASGDKSVINLNEAYISTFDESGSLTKEKRSLTSVQEVIVGTDGELILSEMNWNQVLYWDSIEDAVAGKKPVVLGFSDKNYTNRELGVSSNQTTVVVHPSESTMYMQSGLAYDGMNLWVGEFKFSSRLVLFRKQ